MADNRKIAAIKRAVEKWVRSNSTLMTVYSNWYVGITANPASRKSSHKNSSFFGIRHWKSWDAGTLTNARGIEKYFGVNGKGVYGGGVKGGAIRSSKYIYVYKK